MEALVGSMIESDLIERKKLEEGCMFYTFGNKSIRVNALMNFADNQGIGIPLSFTNS